MDFDLKSQEVWCCLVYPTRKMSADLKELGYSELPLVEIGFKKLQYIM